MGSNSKSKRKSFTDEHRHKLSLVYKGKKLTEGIKQKISEAHMGKKFTAEHKRNLSKAMKGNQNSLGFKHSEETKKKMSILKLKYYKIYGTAAWKSFKHTEASKKKMSETKILQKQSGDKNPNWRGGKSFEPYCSAFNDKLKEDIRNRDNRVCQLCGKSEILNGGKRLFVHHIDGDKMQGCDNKRWYLCALCHACNSSKDTIEKEFLIVSNLEYNKEKD